MTTFDGVDYDDFGWVLPFHYHPAAPFSPVVYSHALQTAYYQARYASRLVLQQSWGLNLADPTVPVAASGYSFAHTAFVDITEGYAHISDQWTHVGGMVLFGAQPGSEATAHHRVNVDDGVTPVTGTDVTQDIHINSSYHPNPAAGPDRDIRDPSGYVQLLVPVALDTLTLDQMVKVTVQSYLAGAAAQPYKPFYVCCWLEVR